MSFERFAHSSWLSAQSFQLCITEYHKSKLINQMRIGLFPGTFDPITIGHLDIIHRSQRLFDKLYIGIGRNSNKTAMFSEEQLLSWIKEIYNGNSKIEA